MLDKNDYIEILFVMMNTLILYLCLLFLSCTIAGATTIQEDIKIRKTVENICKLNNNPCQVEFIPDKKIQAYTTTKGQIVISKGIRNILDYNQLLSVCMHEVGHHLLKHYDRQNEFLKQDRTQSEIIAIRHKHEIEADLFSVSYSLYNNQPSYLPSALRTITSPNKLNTTTPTHPSYNTRTRVITNYQNYITTGQDYRQNNIRYYQPYFLPYNK